MSNIKNANKDKPKQETDLAWKWILSLYFKQFMELCWEQRAKEINWNKKPKFLDKELIKITKDAATGNRVVDQLIEVELIDGHRCCVLIHLEIQATKHEDFSKRMFVYRYRLRDVYDKPIASMAVLLDDDPSWRPNNYSESLWDSSINMHFPIIKLIDYNEHIQTLEQSTNPFATVILAQLAALKKEEVGLKLTTKIQITRRLYALNYSKNEVLALFKFIDLILALPKEGEEEYMRNVAKLEKEEFNKNFICPAEQLWLEQGIERGIEQGLEQGIKKGIKQGATTVAKKIAQKMLNKKGMSLAEIAKLTDVSVAELKTLKEKKH